MSWEYIIPEQNRKVARSIVFKVCNFANFFQVSIVYVNKLVCYKKILNSLLI